METSQEVIRPRLSIKPSVLEILNEYAGNKEISISAALNEIILQSAQRGQEKIHDQIKQHI